MLVASERVSPELPVEFDSALPGIRLAWADLDDATRDWRPLAACLAPDERARALRFRFERDRRRFVVAHAVLRGLLGRALDVDPSEVALATDAFGKPRLRPPSDRLAFNMSHTAGRALYALAHGMELGVDAECVEPRQGLEALAHDVFSAEELAEWQALPAAERLAGFYNGWTRKEAFLKALGRGLDVPLGDFAVSLGPGREPRVLRVPAEAAPPERWRLAALMPEAGYVAAVVAEDPSRR